MRIYQKMTPLTPEEQQFVAENHETIQWCLRLEGYDFDEYYSIAVFGYMKAIKRWFQRPELHEYSFRTIVRWAIKSYIWNERQKEKRRIQAISLNVLLSDSEGLTLLDTITYDNYLNQYVTQ